MGVSRETLRVMADDAVRKVLRLAAGHPPAVCVPSPPGAGKSGLVERVAVHHAGLLGEPVAVACVTRSQSRELLERLTKWERIDPVWFVPKDQRIEEIEGVRIARSPKEINPEGNTVVVATTAKWSRSHEHFPLLVCDEAWQVPFAQFVTVAPLAESLILVGDPAQIAPVVSISIERWGEEGAAPQRPAPEVLRARTPEFVQQVALPATRRLPADTAAVVSSAFYPTMPFGSLAPDDRLVGAKDWDGDRSLSITEVGSPRLGRHDPFLAAEAARFVRAALVGEIVGESGKRAVTPRNVGVVCAYVDQVPQVRAALGSELAEVLVETANRWQGLERDVIVGLHPLSGEVAPQPYAMDAGRLCVMCSRHRVACMLIGRPGLRQAAAAGSGGAERRFGDDDDLARRGWRAHMTLLAREGNAINI
jgi:hypothetical protein